MQRVRLENVGKRYLVSHQKDNLIEGFVPKFSFQKENEEFWALRNITMAVDKGKIIGIIGRNGAGKTTLLSICAGIYAPTEGSVKLNGRVSNLLTLGAGFQDELSGRENIYLDGSILGMTQKEIESKYDNIVQFSELDGFLDTPLHAYSQGMRMRLGFSVTIHVDFDILIIDEMLSVGDVSFQKKCYERLVDFKRQGKTMLLTSQDLDIVERLCDEIYLLENGRIHAQGDPELVASRYLQLLNEKGFSRF